MTDIAKLKKATYHLYTFSISKFISTFGSTIYTFGLSLYVLALTGSATSFAVTVICNVLPKTVLAPIAGYAADRYPKKAVVVISQSISILSIGALLVYSAAAGLSLAAVYTATVLVSASSMFTSVAFSSSIANLIDPARIQKAMAYNQSAVSMATIGGPVIGGLLFGFVSMNVFLLIQLCAYTAAVLLEATMNFKLYSVRAAEERGRGSGGPIASIREGFRYLKTKRIVMVIAAAAVGINFFFSAMMVGLPFIVVEEMNISSAHFGMIEAMIAVGMLAGSVYFSFRKEVRFPLLFSKRGLMALSGLLAGVGLPLVLEMPKTANIFYFLILMLFFGIALVSVNTPIGIMMQKDVEEEYRGRVFGFVESAAMAMMPLGMLVFGLLFDAVPAQYLIWSSAGCLAALTSFLIRPSIIREIYPELNVGLSIQVGQKKKEKLVK